MSTTPDWPVSESDELPPVIAAPGRHSDPAIPSLVLPSPGLTQQPAFTAPAPILDDEPDKKPYPSNYFECQTILSRLRAMRSVSQNPSQQAELLRREKQLAEHINILQGNVRPPQMDIVKSNAECGRYLSRRAEMFAKERAALVAADAASFWPIVPERALTGIYTAALADEPIRMAIDACRKAQRDYKVAWLDAYIYLAPSVLKKEHRQKLTSNCTPEDQAQIELEANILNGEHFSTIARLECVKLRQQYDATVRPAIRTVLNLIQTFIQKAKQAAIEREKEFFQSQGLPYTATQVSRQFDVQLLELLNALAQVDFVSQTPGLSLTSIAPPPENQLQSLFSIPIIPNAE